MNLGLLPARIAWRYLRAPKSHSAVSAISVISVAGVAVATAAIVCVLSVFNGFQTVLADKLDTLAPDIEVTPARGKTFADSDSLRKSLNGFKGVELVMPVVSDNALTISKSYEMPVTLKGVDPTLYGKITSIDSLTLGKTPSSALGKGSVIISAGVATHYGIYAPGEDMLIFAPRREGRVNLANPIESFLTDSVTVSDVFQAMQSEYDEKTVICDITTARDLFQYDTEATSFEVKVAGGNDIRTVASHLAQELGPMFIVKDRFMQQETNFRMIQIEKWVTFLLLVFILVIASFNIISTLCMLILEKEGSMGTLLAIGMNRRDIGHTFMWESLYVSLSGALAGMIIGVVLCLIQQYFGIIKLAGDPGTHIIASYPVKLVWSDLLVAFLPVAAIGIVTACIAGTFARSRNK